jgi:hypothetical protein
MSSISEAARGAPGFNKVDAGMHQITVARAPARAATRDGCLPVLFCIDAEQDEFMPALGQPRPWTTCATVLASIESLRAALTSACGSPVRFNWFVRADPQIERVYGDASWGLKAFRSNWLRLARCDELGLHPHLQRWELAGQRWTCPSDDAAWSKHCIERAVEAFHTVLNLAPVSMRCGNRYVSRAVLQRAGELGVRFDLTSEPGYPGRSDAAASLVGPCPDYRRWPTSPYRPDPDDISIPAIAPGALPWIVPLGNVRNDSGHAEPIYETLMLRMPPEQFRRALDEALARPAPSYFAFVARTDMFELPAARANLATLINHPQARRLAFEMVSEVVTRFDPESCRNQLRPD